MKKVAFHQLPVVLAENAIKRTNNATDSTSKTALMKLATFEWGGASTALAIINYFGRMPHSAHCTVGPYAFEKLAFTTTRQITDERTFAKHMAKLLPIGSPQCKFQRQGHFIRTAALVPQIDPLALQLLKEVVLDAPLSISSNLPDMIKYDKEELQRRHPDQYVLEMALQVGYRGKVFSLASPIINNDGDDDGNSQENTTQNYEKFVKQLTSPERTIIMAVGPDASSLVEVASKVFSPTNTDNGGAGGPYFSEPVGSLESIVDDDLIWLPPSSQTDPTLIEEQPDQEHVHLGLYVPAIPVTDIHLYPAQIVLHSWLGGGGAFSAGGPGKGMFSRLYAKVLNRYHFIESVRSQLQDNLFGLSGSCRREYTNSLLTVLQEQWQQLVDPVTIDESELNRAKQQAASAVLMTGEHRFTLLDQLALSVVSSTGPEPAELAAAIHKVTSQDLQAVCERLFRTGGGGNLPIYVAFGRLPTTLPELNLL